MIKHKLAEREIFVSEKAKFLEDRVIVIDSAITPQIATEVISQVAALSRLPTPITILINSPGGSVHDGFAIIDAMEASPCQITTVATGMAASMAAVILAAGDRRYATARSEIMVHQAMSGVSGQASDIAIAAKHISKIQKNISLFLADKTKHSPKEIMEIMDRDTWLSPQLAKRYKLIDEIGFPLFYKEVL